MPGPGLVRRANGGDGWLLAAGLQALVDRPDFEQAHARKTARGIAAGRFEQVGQGRGPHAVQFRGDGIGQHQGVITPAKQGRPVLAHERPGDGFGIAQSRQRPAAGARLGLWRRQHAARTRIDDGQGYRRNGVEAMDAGDVLDEVGLAFDIAAP